MLSGVAKNAAEKELAAKYTIEVKGVKKGANNMTTQSSEEKYTMKMYSLST
jgi:osmotically-inducible protein OsmY